MNKLIKLGCIALAGTLLFSCETDPEKLEIVKPYPKSDQYYADLRDYKNSDHEIHHAVFLNQDESPILVTNGQQLFLIITESQIDQPAISIMMKIFKLVNQKGLIKRKFIHDHLKNLPTISTHAQVIHAQLVPRIFHVVVRLYPDANPSGRHTDPTSPEYPVARIFHLNPVGRST